MRANLDFGKINYNGTGKIYNGELYRYGCGWVVNDIPSDVLLRIEHIIDAANNR